MFGREILRMDSLNFQLQNFHFHHFVLVMLLDVTLGGGFKHFLFSPLFGEDSHFD